MRSLFRKGQQKERECRHVQFVFQEGDFNELVQWVGQEIGRVSILVLLGLGNGVEVLPDYVLTSLDIVGSHRCASRHFRSHWVHPHSVVELLAEQVADSSTEAFHRPLEDEVADTGSQHIWSLVLPELYVLFLEVRQGHNKLVLGIGDHEKFLYFPNGVTHVESFADLELNGLFLR